MLKKLKIVLFTIGFTLLSSTNLLADGTYTVGAGQTYTTLKAAFDAINAGTISGVLVLEIAADCSESASAVLNASGSGSASYTSINIYPTGATRTISGNIDGILIHFNGSDNVTFNGRLGSGGASNSLIIENESTHADATAFTIDNTAQSNLFQYLTIKGSTTSTTMGIFSILDVPFGEEGNNDNTIDNCIITKSGANKPTICYYDYGGGTDRYNTNNTLSNNQFIDFTLYGVYFYAYAQNSTITDNHFFQTASFTQSTDITVIYINNGGFGGNMTGFSLTNNYIGGQAINCGGSSYTLSSSSHTFTGIHFSAYGSGTNTILNNTISNITSTYTASQTAFTAIKTSYLGTGPTSFVLGNNGNGNTIGSTTGTGDITINLNTGTPSNGFIGFDLGSSNATHTISHNSIGAITINSTSVSSYGRGGILGINYTSNGEFTISNNTFGNSTSQNLNYTSDASSLMSNLVGIRIAGSSTSTSSINNNTIQNYYSNIGHRIEGIYSTNGSFTGLNVFQNTIQNLQTENDDASGIYLTNTNSGTYNIYSNTISNIRSDDDVYGIRTNGSSGSPVLNIYKNKISDFGSNGLTGDWCVGMYIVQSSGTSSADIYNNIVISNDKGFTVAKIFRGIMDYVQGDANVYFNTVKLNASYSSGTGTSAAFTYSGNSANHIIKNNIWQNISSGSGTQQGQRWLSTQTLDGNVSHNYTECTNTSNISFYNSDNRNLATWQGASYTNTSTENSGTITINSDGEVTDASTSDVQNTGTTIAITDDYNSSARSSPPWKGAIEGANALPISLLSFTAQLSDDIVTVNWSTASEMNNDYFIVERSTDGYNFEFLAQVQGGGNTSSLNHYNTLDRSPFTGVSYYRLTQIDYDGESETFTPVSVVNPTATSDNISIFPNPASHSFAVVLQAKNSETVTINIIDLTGKLIRQEQHELERGENGLIFKVENELSRGTYIIQVDSQFSRFAPQRVVVQ